MLERAVSTLLYLEDCALGPEGWSTMVESVSVYLGSANIVNTKAWSRNSTIFCSRQN